jgi:hypothetical protein
VSRAEYLHHSVRPDEASSARRAEYRWQPERSVVTGASEDDRSTVGERSGASSPKHQNRAGHRQRDQRSTVGKRNGASSPEHRRQAEYRRQAERSIVTGALETSGVPSESGAEHYHPSVGAERNTVCETSGAPSASGAEHRQQSIGAERSNISEMSGVPSASGAEHRQGSIGAERTTSIEPNGATLAEKRTEWSTISGASSRAEHLPRLPLDHLASRPQTPGLQSGATCQLRQRDRKRLRHQQLSEVPTPIRRAVHPSEEGWR